MYINDFHRKTFLLKERDPVHVHDFYPTGDTETVF